MKTRLAYLIASSLLLTPAVLAQQSQSKPKKPLNPADVEVLTGRPQGNTPTEAPQKNNGQSAQTNPSKRKPLDWRDVDILTGRAEREARERRYARPYVYVGLSPYDSYYNGYEFSSLDNEDLTLFGTRPRSSALVFSGRGRHIFFDPRIVGSPLVFSPRSRHRGIFIRR